MVAILGKTRRAMPAKKPVPKDTYSGRVAARMRLLREERDWLVSDLTARINKILKDDAVAQSTVHGWDNGSRKIDPDFYPAIARVFGLSVAEFIPEK